MKSKMILRVNSDNCIEVLLPPVFLCSNLPLVQELSNASLEDTLEQNSVVVNLFDPKELEESW
jgi:hypothetical protein